jgi:hypothetical protein
MGKTNQPLTIAVWTGWVDHPEIRALAEKGHEIEVLHDQGTYDLILHPTAHRWDDAYWKMLPQALTQARRQKKAVAQARTDYYRGEG